MYFLGGLGAENPFVLLFCFLLALGNSRVTCPLIDPNSSVILFIVNSYGFHLFNVFSKLFLSASRVFTFCLCMTLIDLLMIFGSRLFMCPKRLLAFFIGFAFVLSICRILKLLTFSFVSPQAIRT